MKKSRNMLILTALCILLSGLAYIGVSYGQKHEKIVLENVFRGTGANFLSSEVYVWAKLDEGFNDVEPLKPVIEEIIGGMNIIKDDKFTWNSDENDILMKSEAAGMTSDGRHVSVEVKINKESITGNKDEEVKKDFNKLRAPEKGEAFADRSEGYISVNVVQDMTADGMEESRELIISTLEKNGIEATANCSVTGTIDGRLDTNQVEGMADEILSKAGGRRIEGIKDKNYISVSAYSPYIQEYIQVRGKKVNLNLAVRYNSYEDKTYIWIATPVITTEY